MSAQSLSSLPDTFTYSEARHAGLSDRQLYRLRDDGAIEKIARGIYRRANAALADVDLAEIGHRASDATLCLATALARHDLIDFIPPVIDVAIPRGRRAPSINAPVAWHRFTPETFHVGRGLLRVDNTTTIGLFSAERSIVDAFRLRHLAGPDLAYEALRNWIRRSENHPSKLLTMARQFPRTLPGLRQALEILL